LKGPVELSVPADLSMMLVIRLTTAGVIARAGLTIDAMDNLKMAVEEACNCLIGQDNPPADLTLRFRTVDKALLITARAGEAESKIGVIDEAELEIVTCILASLADGVAFDVRDGWIHGIELRAELI
jgi:serine/threonine-protein kinase RsbW